jgi:cytochrome c oxidase cbb3-type subunit 2
MSRSSHLFTGIFSTFAVSCAALVLVPQIQIGGLTEHINAEDNSRYPVVNTRPGREIYVREGCYYCHTQQIRDVQNGTDIARGWGVRRTVARDYLFENPPLLGAARVGPDLANIGSAEWRNEDKEDPRRPKKRDRQWHLEHLYNPRILIPHSTMPPYRYLFDEVKVGAQLPEGALSIPASREGYVIVPKPEAIQLVDYLLSLDRSTPLPEAGGTTPAAANP